MGNFDLALTFDDVLLLPDYSEIMPSQVALTTKLTRQIPLNIPILSAAMDTVTEGRMAIGLAHQGGIGVIHRNCSIEKQCTEVALVKRYGSGVIRKPVTVSPDDSVRELLNKTRLYGISGVPVTEQQGVLVGIVTSRDLRFEINLDQPVRNIMTPRDRLVTIRESTSEGRIRQMLHEHRVEKLPVVDDQFKLCGLVTVKDLQKRLDYPAMSMDQSGQMLVAAAVGTGTQELDRAQALIENGADVVVVDSAHGDSQGVIEQVRQIKKQDGDVPVIGGNIATATGAARLIEAGADALKVGIGPGSICTTRVIAGVGVPQLSAIMEVANYAKNHDICVIADGGIRFSGDIVKALAAGAHTVMIGSLLAGTDEAPGALELYRGRSYKSYRGMGSVDAMRKGSKERYQQGHVPDHKLVPEGVEGRVPYRGAVHNIIDQLTGGLRAGMGYVGSATIEALQHKARFIRVTDSSRRESHPHDVYVVKEAPNYHRDVIED